MPEPRGRGLGSGIGMHFADLYIYIYKTEKFKEKQQTGLRMPQIVGTAAFPRRLFLTSRIKNIIIVRRQTEYKN